MPSRIDVGLRHAISIYPLLALAGGFVLSGLLGPGPWHRASSGLAILILVCLLIESGLAQSDNLAYFNLPALPYAERITADSDFDWGQDTARLDKELARRRINTVSVALASGKLWCCTVLPLWPNSRPASSWVAVSIGCILHDQIAPPYDGLRWLECYQPVATVGKTIRLYWIPTEC